MYDSLRDCIVYGKPAKFHRWGDIESGSGFVVIGVVEFSTGEVKCVDPYEIKFSKIEPDWDDDK